MAQTVTGIMTGHHQHCDGLFATAKERVDHNDWQAAQQAFQQLTADLEWHMQAEENQLFPAFEAATGMTRGPTAVMRAEHGELRELMASCREALVARNPGDFAGHARAMSALLEEHNAKEENILYPMCDRVLGARGETLAASFATEAAAQLA